MYASRTLHLVEIENNPMPLGYQVDSSGLYLVNVMYIAIFSPKIGQITMGITIPDFLRFCPILIFRSEAKEEERNQKKAIVIYIYIYSYMHY